MPEPEYESGLQVRRVQAHGGFNWKGHEVFLTETLGGERIGLEAVDERYWCVYFAAFPIAWFDSRELVTKPLPVDRETQVESINKNKDGPNRWSYQRAHSAKNSHDHCLIGNQVAKGRCRVDPLQQSTSCRRKMEDSEKEANAFHPALR